MQNINNNRYYDDDGGSGRSKMQHTKKIMLQLITVTVMHRSLKL